MPDDEMVYFDVSFEMRKGMLDLRRAWARARPEMSAPRIRIGG